MNENLGMSTELKTRMAKRLDALMKNTEGMGTLKEVAAKSHTSYGTVRRLRSAEATDVSIGLIELVAKSFGLSITQFVADTEDFTILSEAEKKLIQAYRKLPTEWQGKLQILATRQARIESIFLDDESTQSKLSK